MPKLAHLKITDSALLIKRLRDVMASDGTSQQHLQHVLSLIEEGKEIELCALYIRKNNHRFEFFLGAGKNVENLEGACFAVGEGLVGYIASTGLPLFLSTPEHNGSLMGLPLIKKARVIGVLTLHRKSQQFTSESDIDLYETCATFLAELVEGCTHDSSATLDPGYFSDRLFGKKIIGGFALGHAVLHHPEIEVENVVSSSPEKELKRLEKAIKKLSITYATKQNETHSDLINTYRFLLKDKRWVNQIKEGIKEGLTTEAALYHVKQATQLRFQNIHHPDFKEKGVEFANVANELYYILSGLKKPSQRNIPKDSILIAKSMAIAELLDYNRAHLKGLILEEASPNSHLAIVAKSLDLPVISRIKGLFERLQEGDPLILDAEHGLVLIKPTDTTKNRYREQLVLSSSTETFKGPAVTLDGTHIPVKINAGFEADLINLKGQGIEGVGLYRSEIPFMMHANFPSVDEQQALYTRIFNQIDHLPICFRTLDLGADKFTPYFQQNIQETNPAMGWRSTRISLDKPLLLRQQLRALLSAGSGRSFSVMFPMVTEVDELMQIKSILNTELEQIDSPPPKSLKLGVMLEVPSLTFQLDQLLPQVDFISLGTNDLFQFLYASDRNSDHLDNRYDPLSPGFLKCIKHIIDAVHRQGKKISACGEMVSNPLDALTLIALGIHELSVAKSSATTIKKAIANVNLATFSPFVHSLLDRPLKTLREKIRHYTQDHAILIS